MFDFIAGHANHNPDRTAITAPNRTGLSYGALHDLIQRTGADLNKFGVGRGTGVAVVLPNGPEMAAVVVSVSSYATITPLNPNCRKSEFERFLDNIDAQALIVSETDPSPAVDVAQSRGIQVLTMTVEPESAAGLFRLYADDKRFCRAPGLTDSSDVVLALHTPGTTTNPKLIRLNQRHLVTSATNIAKSLALGPSDRCLNIMPLFHVHGLMAALFATMRAGSCVSCTPGFFAPRFFEWLDDQVPTWYTAVPTMHQAILSRAEQNPDVIVRSRLRFIRSSSSPLPPQVIDALEKVMCVPVIEAYGMTEAAHQIASNPLPPGQRKWGSVGLQTGPTLQIMAFDRDVCLDVNQTGEVVIRGDSVVAPEGEGFRTGDLGYLDEDGYLFLTGRLQDINNRSGEQISPREFEEVVHEDPRSEAEQYLADMWGRMLGEKQVGTRHRFLDLGGDSMLAAQLVADIRESLGVGMTIVDFFNAPTIVEQARVVEQLLHQDINDGGTGHLVA